MLKYVASRIGQSVVVLWLAYTLVFFAVNALPSDQIEIVFSPADNLDPATADQIRSYYGLDRPLLEQYWSQLWQVVHGDLGFSVSTGQPVSQRITDAAGNTVTLASTALLLACLLAVGTAYGARMTTSRVWRTMLRASPELFSSIPTFWLGLVVLYILAFQLRVMSIFPDGGIASLLVPAAVLAISVSAPITQVLTNSIDAAYGSGYVATARAKGAPRRRVLLHHVAKNAIGPGVTVVGLSIGSLFAGSVVTETVFSRSGLGSVLIQALTNKDVALVQALVLLTAFIVVVVNLLVDLVYPLLDPRILTSSRRRRERGWA